MDALAIAGAEYERENQVTTSALFSAEEMILKGETLGERSCLFGGCANYFARALVSFYRVTLWSGGSTASTATRAPITSSPYRRRSTLQGGRGWGRASTCAAVAGAF